MLSGKKLTTCKRTGNLTPVNSIWELTSSGTNSIGRQSDVPHDGSSRRGAGTPGSVPRGMNKGACVHSMNIMLLTVMGQMGNISEKRGTK